MVTRQWAGPVSFWLPSLCVPPAALPVHALTQLTCTNPRAGGQHELLGPSQHEPVCQLQAEATQAPGDDVALVSREEGLGHGRHQRGCGRLQHGLPLLLTHLQSKQSVFTRCLRGPETEVLAVPLTWTTTLPMCFPWAM